MWTIRRSHRHIKPETLSEYLDGRLQAAALARVGRELASCGACRDELDSLRATVTMLRQLPEEAPRRSFTMAAPPPEPVRARPAPFLRIPQWAYAGAVSLAVIVLVVLVSADTMGLLAPGEPTTSREPAAAPESEDGQFQAPAPAAQPVPAGEAATEQSPPSLAMAADAGSAEKPAAAPTRETEEAASLGTPAGPAAESGAVPPEPRTRAAPPLEEGKVAAAGPEPGELPGARREGTAVIWRVLEGLAAALGLVFVAGLVMRVKFSRRNDRG